MTEEFNKTLFFDNISFKLKETGKKIGELENEAGVSPGYISRTSKDGNTKPGIDFIMKVAEALKVSIDTLLKVDLTQLTPTEQYLIAFLEKLLKDTVADKLGWEKESAEYLNTRLEMDNNGNTQHPLFQYKSFYEENEDGYDALTSRIVFTSHQYDVHNTIEGDCYNLKMKNHAVLYLMNTRGYFYYPDDSNAHAIEIWMCSPTGGNHFLCNDKGTPALSRLTDQLYSAITENLKHPKVHKDIKNVIDAFMIGDMSDDEDIPF